MKDKLVLRNPIVVNGKTLKELEYDFNEITCEQYTMAYNYADAKTMQVTQLGRPAAAVMEQNGSLHMYLGMAAIMAINKEIDIVDLERIKGIDIIEVAKLGRNFIAGRLDVSGQDISEGQSGVTPESTEQE